jgi:hypothetical protein
VDKDERSSVPVENAGDAGTGKSKTFVTLHYLVTSFRVALNAGGASKKEIESPIGVGEAHKVSWRGHARLLWAPRQRWLQLMHGQS